VSLKSIILDLFGAPPEPDPPAPPPRAARPAPPSPASPPAAPGARAEAGVLAILRRHGAPHQRLMFTRNRRTMISVGRDRSLIRMHVAFASADEAVLAAVAVVYTPGVSSRKREAAKRVVRAFIRTIPTERVAARPLRRYAHPADRVQLERMQAVFDQVNRAAFGGKLPRVPIHLSRKMRRRNGHFSSHPLEIVISWRLCVHGAAGEAEETMRHEMIHLWQYIEGLPVDHGPVFRRAARRLDVHPRATRPVRWKRG
jgi:hypothetical protein